MGDETRTRRGPATAAATQLELKMKALLRTSLSASTRIAYERQWDKFQLFVHSILGKKFTLPVSPLILGKYITHLCITGYSYATIVSVISIISFAHKIRNLPDPANSFVITKLLVGVKKKAGSSDQRQPVTLVLMKKFMCLIDLLWGESYTGVLLKAIIAVMFALGLRVGEAIKSATTEHTLEMDNISWI